MTPAAAPIGLAFFQGQRVTEYSLLAAARTLVALPIVLLDFFCCAGHLGC